MRAIVAATALLGGLAMTDTADARRLTLTCAVTGATDLLAPNFATDFCAELRRGLAETAGFDLVSGADALDVAVTVGGRNRAEVRLTLRRAAGGETAVTRSLRSQDSGLRPFAARTLLLDIDRLVGGR